MQLSISRPFGWASQPARTRQPVTPPTAQPITFSGLFSWGEKRYHLEFNNRKDIKRFRKIFPNLKVKDPFFGRAHVLMTRNQYIQMHKLTAANGERPIVLINNVHKSGGFLH